MENQNQNVAFLNDSAQELFQSSPDLKRFTGLNSKKLRKVRRKKNAETLRQHAEYSTGGGFTNDAVSGSGAYHLARDLEYEYNEVLREEYAPNNSLQYVPTDNRVPPGARQHSVERISHEGSVEVYRGRSDNKPSTGVSKDKETFPVLTYVTSIRLDFFEQQSDSFAGTNLRSELEFAARQAMMDFLNEQTWFGDEANGLPGTWTYPYLPKTPSGVKMDGSESPDDVLAEIHRIARLPAITSKQRYYPNTILTSDRIRDYWAETKRSGTTEDTILEAFLRDNSYVDQVEGIPEARNAGPNGEDLIFGYRRNDRMSMANSIVQGFQMLPIQERGMDLVIPCYMQHGGVIMRNALNNVLAYAEVD
jgi:hypothetical protein